MVDTLKEMNSLKSNKEALWIKVVHRQGPSMDKHLTTLGGHTLISKLPLELSGILAPPPEFPFSLWNAS